MEVATFYKWRSKYSKPTFEGSEKWGNYQTGKQIEFVLADAFGGSEEYANEDM